MGRNKRRMNSLSVKNITSMDVREVKDDNMEM